MFLVIEYSLELETLACYILIYCIYILIKVKKFFQIMRYRTKNDIIAKIIEVAKERPVTKTRIAYDCFLSYDLLNEYLKTLIMSDLLKFNKRDKTYIATKRGLHIWSFARLLEHTSMLSQMITSRVSPQSFVKDCLIMSRIIMNYEKTCISDV